MMMESSRSAELIARGLPLCAPGRTPLLAETSRAMSSADRELSIIIPAYNEELRLPTTLEQIAAYANRCHREVEVLVVDDGSTDRTAAVAEAFRGKLAALRVVPNGVNRGKGF